MGNYRHKLLVERAMKRLDERTPMGASNLHQNESIAYADLPWAEKTQTTVNEGKDSEKLFGNKKRLNEAIDRMFEDAVEIGANLKTEEEMMSK
jgi:hypothetical protein